MGFQNIVEILFMPLRILRDNTVPLLGISFMSLFLGFFIVAGLSIPLLKYILSLGYDTNADRHSQKDR